jgi:hypothetical protein
MKKLKKMFTRILALALVTVFFTAPSVAPSVVQAATTPQPVLIQTDEWLKFYEYQPTPKTVRRTISEALRNTTRSDNKWYIPANNQGTFHVSFAYPCDYRITIIRDGVSGVYYGSDYYNSKSMSISLDPTPTNGYYQFVVTALSDEIAIKDYLGLYNAADDTD